MVANDDYIRLMTGSVHYSHIVYLSHSLSDAILSLGSFSESLIKYLSRGPRCAPFIALLNCSETAPLQSATTLYLVLLYVFNFQCPSHALNSTPSSALSGTLPSVLFTCSKSALLRSATAYAKYPIQCLILCSLYSEPHSARQDMICQ